MCEFLNKDLEFLKGMLSSKRIIVSNKITKEVQARKHRKRRINKKWIKRYGYKCVPDNSKIISIDDCLFMTEKAYEKLRIALEEY